MPRNHRIFEVGIGTSLIPFTAAEESNQDAAEANDAVVQAEALALYDERVELSARLEDLTFDELKRMLHLSRGGS